MEFVSRFEVAPFSALINMIKFNTYEKTEIFKTLLAVLCDYNPTDEKSKERTTHYIELLLQDNKDLATCLLSFLPSNSINEVKQPCHKKSRVSKRQKKSKQKSREKKVQEHVIKDTNNIKKDCDSTTRNISTPKKLKLMDPSSIQEVVKREIKPTNHVTTKVQLNFGTNSLTMCAPICTVVPSQNLPKMSPGSLNRSIYPKTAKPIEKSSFYKKDMPVLFKDHTHGSTSNAVYSHTNVSADFPSFLLPDFPETIGLSQQNLNNTYTSEQGNYMSEQTNLSSLPEQQGNMFFMSRQQENLQYLPGQQRNLHSVPGQPGNLSFISGQQGNLLSKSEQGNQLTGVQNQNLYNVPLYNAHVHGKSDASAGITTTRSYTPVVPFQPLVTNSFHNSSSFFPVMSNEIPMLSSNVDGTFESSLEKSEPNHLRAASAPVYLGTNSNLASFPYTQQLILPDGQTQNVYFKGSSVQLPTTKEMELQGNLNQNMYQSISQNFPYRPVISETQNFTYQPTISETLPFFSGQSRNSATCIPFHSSVVLSKAANNFDINAKTKPKKYTLAPNQVARKKLKLTPAQKVQNPLGSELL